MDYRLIIGFQVTNHYFTVDYNSWVESDKGRRLAASLDKDVVLAEGMFDAPRSW